MASWAQGGECFDVLGNILFLIFELLLLYDLEDYNIKGRFDWRARIGNLKI